MTGVDPMGDPRTGRLDPRRHAYRDDLAAEVLRGTIARPRYVAGEHRQVMREVTPLRRRPRADAGLDTEVLFGETVTVFDESGGWAWVQLERDRYVGYVAADALTGELRSASHRVTVPATFLYPIPDIKAPPLMQLSMNARLDVAEHAGAMSRLATGGFVLGDHIGPLDQTARDFVEVALWFSGAPYLWGGRTWRGLDCSGLVQTALEAAGVRCPRDSDLQQAELGSPLPAARDGRARGDLVFWQGHVGIMIDAVSMVHANAYHMAVAVEPLAVAADRIARSGGAIVAVRRLDALST